MTERMVLGLTGFSGTGKSTLATELEEAHSFTLFEGSSLLKASAEANGTSLSVRADYDNYFRSQQLIQSRSWLADIMLSSGHTRVVQVGLRAPYDFKRIKSVGGIVIAAVCPPEQCVRRIDTSNPKNAQSVEEYLEHMALETSPDEFGSNTAWCVDRADYTIDTSQPKEIALEQLGDLVATLRAA